MTTNKDTNLKDTIFSVRTLLWFALLLALAGSLRHVAHTFTSVDGNTAWGWVQAMAVDAGLFALALAIQMRRREGRSALVIWVGVALFSGISVYANLAYGLTHTLNTLPDWVVSTKPYVLAGALPILVLYLAEIVGSDVSHAKVEAEKEQKAAERKANKTSITTPSVVQTAGIIPTAEQAEQARTVKAEQDALSKGERLDKLLDIVTEQPGVGVSTIARELDVSRTTIYADIEQLTDAGQVEKNGNGLQATG